MRGGARPAIDGANRVRMLRRILLDWIQTRNGHCDGGPRGLNSTSPAEEFFSKCSTSYPRRSWPRSAAIMARTMGLLRYSRRCYCHFWVSSPCTVGVK